jgi:hypothetical protein
VEGEGGQREGCWGVWDGEEGGLSKGIGVYDKCEDHVYIYIMTRNELHTAFKDSFNDNMEDS